MYDVLAPSNSFSHVIGVRIHSYSIFDSAAIVEVISWGAIPGLAHPDPVLAHPDPDLVHPVLVHPGRDD